MLRNCRKVFIKNNVCPIFIQKKNFLTNDYKCTEAWNNMNSSPVFNKISVHDFYNVLDQNYASKGVLSAIDVDMFANVIKDPSHLEELKDLLHKLRTTAETGNMLDSTHQATIRNFMEFGDVKELIEILKDPLNYGVFLDDYTANMLLDKLITLPDYEMAARVASLIMLQEEYNNEITCALCQYACYKYIINYTAPPPKEPPAEKPKKVEEIKIRVKYLRNPYFDDHFDIKDTLTLSGKTLAWISERASNNLNNNLQIIGWLIYKKYDTLSVVCEKISNDNFFKVYKEVIELIQKAQTTAEDEFKPTLKTCISTLSKIEQNSDDTSLEKSLEVAIENAINKSHNNDISQQKQLFQSWAKLRNEKLEEQAQRLDRACRIQLIQQKQNEMKDQEQKLWFFENEDQIDLQIEEKEQVVDKSTSKKTATKISEDNYIPPEIRPKRK